MISQLINVIKSISLRKILTVFLAGIFVIITTACSASPPASNVTGSGEYQRSKGQGQNLYEPRQSQKSDGMYPYEDMDTEASASTKGQVRKLKKNAEKNVSKVNSPEEFAESFKNGTPLDERVKNFSSDVADSAKQLTEDVKSGTKRNVRQLKENAQNAIENPENIGNNS
jgi:hypothetical protein